VRRYERLFFPLSDRTTAAKRAAGRIQLVARRIKLAEAGAGASPVFFADFKAGYDSRLDLLSPAQPPPSASSTSPTIGDDSCYPPSPESFDAPMFFARLDAAEVEGIVSAPKAAAARAAAQAMVEAAAAAAVSRSCACVGSPCLRCCGHGASIGGGY
jgi:hypothetical protein